MPPNRMYRMNVDILQWLRLLWLNIFLFVIFILNSIRGNFSKNYKSVLIQKISKLIGDKNPPDRRSSVQKCLLKQLRNEVQ